VVTAVVVFGFGLADTVGGPDAIELELPKYELDFLQHELVVGANDQVSGDAVCRGRNGGVGSKGQLDRMSIASGQIGRACSQSNQGCDAGNRLGVSYRC